MGGHYDQYLNRYYDYEHDPSRKISHTDSGTLDKGTHNSKQYQRKMNNHHDTRDNTLYDYPNHNNSNHHYYHSQGIRTNNNINHRLRHDSKYFYSEGKQYFNKECKHYSYEQHTKQSHDNTHKYDHLTSKIQRNSGKRVPKGDHGLTQNKYQKHRNSDNNHKGNKTNSNIKNSGKGTLKVAQKPPKIKVDSGKRIQFGNNHTTPAL